MTFDERPLSASPAEGRTFSLEGEDDRVLSLVKTRPNQQRFRFQVLHHYGHKCAVCEIREPQLLVAAHIRSKGERGSDDWQNGLPLCATHHTAFDLHMFSVEPGSNRIVVQAGLNANTIGIKSEALSLSRNFPHLEAIEWRWEQAQKAWK